MEARHVRGMAMWVLDPANSGDLIAALRPHAREPDFEVCWVGEGWRDIVTQCHRAIVAEFPEYELLTIKQKYGVLSYQAFPRRWIRGELRFTDDEDSALDAITEAAWLASETVCEWCGGEAELRDNRTLWLTLCSPCNDRFPDPPHQPGGQLRATAE
ncbi:MAG: hypothetical protein LBV34_05355 [Nocardiopsaceae bacterium]|jgi:hypothetical protein|nr:hypothetical protein [Nocardiopsaceae bacterium]